MQVHPTTAHKRCVCEAAVTLHLAASGVACMRECVEGASANRKPAHHRLKDIGKGDVTVRSSTTTCHHSLHHQDLATFWLEEVTNSQ